VATVFIVKTGERQTLGRDEMNIEKLKQLKRNSMRSVNLKL